ncbi:hypothetical protein LXL04_013127 [Taraxacum kok-saghyz]
MDFFSFWKSDVTAYYFTRNVSKGLRPPRNHPKSRTKSMVIVYHMAISSYTWTRRVKHVCPKSLTCEFLTLSHPPPFSRSAAPACIDRSKLPSTTTRRRPLPGNDLHSPVHTQAHNVPISELTQA